MQRAVSQPSATPILLEKFHAGIHGGAAQLPPRSRSSRLYFSTALGAAGGAGLDLAGVQGCGQDRAMVVSRRLAGSGGRRWRCTPEWWASWMASRVSERVPIWLSLMRMELPQPSWMPLERRSVLVTKRSSPTSWTRPPSSFVSSCQPSQSSSSRASSMEKMG